MTELSMDVQPRILCSDIFNLSQRCLMTNEICPQNIYTCIWGFEQNSGFIKMCDTEFFETLIRNDDNVQNLLFKLCLMHIYQFNQFLTQCLIVLVQMIFVYIESCEQNQYTLSKYRCWIWYKWQIFSLILLQIKIELHIHKFFFCKICIIYQL